MEHAGEEKKITAESVLVAVGREAVTEGLGLENTGVTLDRGYIKAGESYITDDPAIYAIGDANGGLLLVHVAGAEGEIAAKAITGEPGENLDVNRVPRITYSHPPVASVGLTEQQAKDAGLNAKSARYSFRGNAMALIKNDPEGFAKIVYDADSGDLLGAHIIGHSAGELISEADARALRRGVGLGDRRQHPSAPIPERGARGRGTDRRGNQHLQVGRRFDLVSTKEVSGALGLTTEQLLDIYYKMFLTRTVGERERMLNRMGKGPFAVTGEGHEAAQVGVTYALRQGHDWVVPYYRDLGVALSFGQTPRDLLLEHLSRAEAISSGGRNMPSHFSDPKLRIVTGSAPVATHLPHATGIALAAKLRGLDEVAAVYFGDGGTSTGDCHEAMNFAGVQKLPVIFVCENNGYAISVRWSQQAAVPDVAVRAAGYGFPGVTVDGNDVLAVYAAAKEAVDRARRGEGATFIEAKTYRLVPHTSDDDDRRYRTADEVEEWRKKDPIIRFAKWLKENGVAGDKEIDEVQARALHEVDEATDYAENAPTPDPASALDHVFVDEKAPQR